MAADGVQNDKTHDVRAKLAFCCGNLNLEAV